MTQNGIRMKGIAKTIHRYEALLQRKTHAVIICGRLRLAIAVGDGVGVWWLWPTHSMLALVSAASGIAVFFYVVAIKLRIDRAIEQNQRRIALTRTMVAQLSMRWSAVPAYTGPDHPTHPYAHDLNIIGQRSLIQLLDHSVTESGHRRLLDLLLSTPASVEAIRTRQAIVRQLTRRRVLLVKLFCSRGSSRIDDGRVTRAFTTTKIPANARLAAWVFGLLAVVNGLLLLTLGAHSAIPWAGVGTYLLSYISYYAYASLGALFSQAVSIEYELNGVRDLLAMVERRTEADTPELAELCSPFQGNTYNRPSAVLNRLSREVAFLSVRVNPLVHIILNTLVPWDLIFAIRYARALKDTEALWLSWVAQLNDIEAYACLASFAHNRPQYCWPLLDDSCVFLESRGLGHPLIPEKNRVTNDISLSTHKRIGVLTGSNMSGKSAFLRTLGINACLANAGGAVCAGYYRSSLLFIYCSISVSDSLADGVSLFYSEALRLKSILSAAQATDSPDAVLVLVDEIFKGTNNRERIIGSRCYLEALSGLNCLGLVSSHDLEVARFGEKEGLVINYHFREFVRNDELVFDYKLRPGICRTTNALLIMQQVGLPVVDEGIVRDIEETSR